MIELTHLQAQVLRGLLIRTKNLLVTVESVERDAAVKDCESYAKFLLEQMQKQSPCLTRHYADQPEGERL